MDTCQDSSLGKNKEGLNLAGAKDQEIPYSPSFNLRYADDTTLMTESEELKSLLMKVKEESGKS